RPGLVAWVGRAGHRPHDPPPRPSPDARVRAVAHRRQRASTLAGPRGRGARIDDADGDRLRRTGGPAVRTRVPGVVGRPGLRLALPGTVHDAVVPGPAPPPAASRGGVAERRVLLGGHAGGPATAAGTARAPAAAD